MNKKHIIYSIVIAAITLLNTSCSDFLDVEPKSSWGIDGFYDTESKVELALSGMYGYYATDDVYGQAMSIIMESGTDEGYYNRRYNDNWSVGLYRHTPLDPYVTKLWTALYSSINLANLFIEKLDKTAFTPEQYNAYLAEAKFIRAHSYSLLASWWNEVPMPLTYTIDQDANDLASSSLEDIYGQIIEDFKFAAEYLPSANSSNYIPGRASNMAAHGLLARAYLKMAGFPMLDKTKYKLAKEECELIINDGYHSLNSKYKDVFLHYIQNTYDTKESIFEISFSHLQDLGITTHGRIGGINGVSFNYGGGRDGYPAAYAMENVSPVLTNVYTAADERQTWNIAGYQYTNKGDAKRVTDPLASQYCPGKFRRWEPANYDDLDTTPAPGTTEPYVLLETVTSPSKNFTSINFPVLRYSDVLLMCAEAINAESGVNAEAIGYLDQVRHRAGLGDISVDNPGAVASKDNFLKELQDERLRELCFEGLRKHDLIRWGILGERLEFQNETIKGQPTFSPSNENHKAYLRAGLYFDPNKHLSLPYPLQEVSLNKKLDQKAGW